MDLQNEGESQKIKKPFYKQWWFYLIIGIVVVALIGIIFGEPVTEPNDGTKPDDNIIVDDNNVSNAGELYYQVQHPKKKKKFI